MEWVWCADVAGVVKPKRKYTRRSDKWKIKKAKSEDEDERTPGVMPSITAL